MVSNQKQAQSLKGRERGVIRRALAAGVLAVVIFLATLGLVGASYERAYAGKMLPGVTILGLKMGGKSYAEARALAEARAEAVLDHQLGLTFPDGTTETVSPRGLGLTLQPAQLVESAYQRGRIGTFLDRWSEMILLITSGEVFAFRSSFETDDVLEKLEDLLVKHEVAQVNASLRLSDGKLAITPAKAGLRVERKTLAENLETIFRTLELPPQIDVPTIEVKPDLVEADLEPIRAEAERITSLPLPLKTNTEAEFEIAAKTLASWVVAQVTEAGVEISWNESKIKEELAKIAKKTDKKMRAKKVDSATAEVFDAGEAGAALDRDGALESIKLALADRVRAPTLSPIKTTVVALAVNEVPITEQKVVKPFTPGLYPGKYVEVNLLEQKLYQWDGEQLLATYDVSTGKWSHPTPEGTLYVKNHIPYAYSRKYDLYMPKWLGLARNPDGSQYEGYGIHELPEWRGGKKEGQSHLGRPVSHGCIRLGVGPAQNIYDWAEEGMPVYIHR